MKMVMAMHNSIKFVLRDIIFNVLKANVIECPSVNPVIKMSTFFMSLKIKITVVISKKSMWS